MKRYLSLMIALILSASCHDNLSESSLRRDAYDPSKDQDTDADMDNTDDRVNALHYGPGHPGYQPQTWPSGGIDNNTIYYLEADVFIDENVSVSDDRVYEVLTGNAYDSVNNNLYQAGILISKINIYRSKKPDSSYAYTDDFIFNKDGAEALLRDADGNSIDESKGTRFRMGIHNTDGSGGIAADYPVTNAFAFNSNSGRNLISHEIGHIFKLWHTNVHRDAPCEYARSHNRTMLNTIFDQSWRFVDCEIAIMRQYASNLMNNGAGWVQTLVFTGMGAKTIDFDVMRNNLSRTRRGSFTSRGGAFDGSGGRLGEGGNEYETCNNK